MYSTGSPAVFGPFYLQGESVEVGPGMRYVNDRVLGIRRKRADGGEEGFGTGGDNVDRHLDGTTRGQPDLKPAVGIRELRLAEPGNDARKMSTRAIIVLRWCDPTPPFGRNVRWRARRRPG
jgi:hypothetical protein